MIDLRRCRTARPPRRLFGTTQVESLEARLVMSVAPTTVSLGLGSSPIQDGEPLPFAAGLDQPGNEVDETLPDGSADLAPVVLNTFSQPSPEVLSTNVRPSGFLVTGLAAQVVAGVEQTFTITAIDANGDPLLDFNGSLYVVERMSAQGERTRAPLPQSIYPANIVQFVNGSGIAKVIFRNAGTVGIVVTDFTETVPAKNSAVVEVVPNEPWRVFAYSPSFYSRQFEPFQINIDVYDIEGNVVTGYNGTLIFSSSDPRAILPTSLVVQNGKATTEITFQTGGPQTFVLTDSVNPALNFDGFSHVQHYFKGIVYRDDNANGIRDPGEVGLAGREVFLDFNDDGVQQPLEPAATSGADGSVLFPLTGPLIDPFGAGIAPQGIADSLQHATLLSLNQSDGSLGLGLVPFSPLAPVTIYPNPEQPRILPFLISVDRQIDYVRTLYRAVLGRDAAGDEVDPWVAALKAGTSRQTVSAAFVNSPEHRLQQVTSYYRTFLDRDLDPTASVWVERLRNGASETEVVAAILDSPEYQAKNQDNNAFVADLYSDVLGRRVDDVGLADKTSLLASDVSRSTIIDRTLNSVEAVDQVLDGFYSVYLRRQRDATSKVWSDTLFSSAGSITDVAASILASDEFFQNAQA